MNKNDSLKKGDAPPALTVSPSPVKDHCSLLDVNT